MTPNIALGGNSSIESVAVLVNQLRSLMHFQQGERPSRHQLGRAFAAYQKARVDRVRAIMEYSQLITRLQAWDNPLFKFAATWVVPYLVPDRLVADDLSQKFIATAPKLDFVPVDKEFARGKLEWADEKADNLKQKSQKTQAAIKVEPDTAKQILAGHGRAANFGQGQDMLATMASAKLRSKASPSGLPAALIQLCGALTALITAAYFMIVVA